MNKPEITLDHLSAVADYGGSRPYALKRGSDETFGTYIAHFPHSGHCWQVWVLSSF
jgi:hypothetical protein